MIIGRIGKKLVNIHPFELSSDAIMWNKFIDDICIRKAKDLTPTQRNAVLSFWYDAEMNSGGHSGYYSCYNEISDDDLIAALNNIGAEGYATNFVKACSSGADDDYAETDDSFYEMTPSLTDIIMDYVLKYSLEIDIPC